MVQARRNSFKSPKPDPVRLLVYDIFREVNRSDGYSNLLLPQALSDSKFEQRDKGFATELLYGSLRMQGRHDYIAEQISDRKWSEVDTGIVDVVRLGAHQLFEMRVPNHAAVSAGLSGWTNCQCVGHSSGDLFGHATGHGGQSGQCDCDGQPPHSQSFWVETPR